MVIAGNKCDLEKMRQVPESDALAYAEKVQAQHFKTSAKIGMGVDELFLAVARLIIKIQDEEAKTVRLKRPKLEITSDPPPPPDSGCC